MRDPQCISSLFACCSLRLVAASIALLSPRSRSTKSCIILAQTLFVSAACADEPVRTWTSANGKFSLEAALVDIAGDTIELRAVSGKKVRVKKEKLGAEDRNYLAQHSRENPTFGSAEDFLEQYRKLRAAPQCKLLAYKQREEVEWRCIVYETSQTGLDYLVARLPFADPQQLEIEVWTEQPGIANQIWPVLLELKNKGLKPELEVTVRGQITAINRGLKDGNDKLTRPKAVIANATVAISSKSRETGKSRQPDLLAVRKFWADWKSVNADDPDGSLWLIDQFRAAGFDSEKRYRWQCTLREYRDSYYFADLPKSRANEPHASVFFRDGDVSQQIGDQFPLDVIVEGRITLAALPDTVSFHDAELVTLDDTPHRRPAVAKPNAGPSSKDIDVRTKSKPEGLQVKSSETARGHMVSTDMLKLDDSLLVTVVFDIASSPGGRPVVDIQLMMFNFPKLKDHELRERRLVSLSRDSQRCNFFFAEEIVNDEMEMICRSFKTIDSQLADKILTGQKPLSLTFADLEYAMDDYKDHIEEAAALAKSLVR